MQQTYVTITLNSSNTATSTVTKEQLCLQSNKLIFLNYYVVLVHYSLYRYCSRSRTYKYQFRTVRGALHKHIYIFIKVFIYIFCLFDGFKNNKLFHYLRFNVMNTNSTVRFVVHMVLKVALNNTS